MPSVGLPAHPGHARDGANSVVQNVGSYTAIVRFPKEHIRTVVSLASAGASRIVAPPAHAHMFNIENGSVLVIDKEWNASKPRWVPGFPDRSLPAVFGIANGLGDMNDKAYIAKLPDAMLPVDKVRDAVLERVRFVGVADQEFKCEANITHDKFAMVCGGRVNFHNRTATFIPAWAPLCLDIAGLGSPDQHLYNITGTQGCVSQRVPFVLAPTRAAERRPYLIRDAWALGLIESKKARHYAETYRAVRAHICPIEVFAPAGPTRAVPAVYTQILGADADAATSEEGRFNWHKVVVETVDGKHTFKAPAGASELERAWADSLNLNYAGESLTVAHTSDQYVPPTAFGGIDEDGITAAGNTAAGVAAAAAGSTSATIATARRIAEVSTRRPMANRRYARAARARASLHWVLSTFVVPAYTRVAVAHSVSACAPSCAMNVICGGLSKTFV